MNRKQYDALPKGTKVVVRHPNGSTDDGIICKRTEWNRKMGAIVYSVVSVGGHTPGDYAPQFIHLPEPDSTSR